MICTRDYTDKIKGYEHCLMEIFNLELSLVRPHTDLIDNRMNILRKTRMEGKIVIEDETGKNTINTHTRTRTHSCTHTHAHTLSSLNFGDQSPTYI